MDKIVCLLLFYFTDYFRFYLSFIVWNTTYRHGEKTNRKQKTSSLVELGEGLKNFGIDWSHRSEFARYEL